MLFHLAAAAVTAADMQTHRSVTSATGATATTCDVAIIGAGPGGV